VGRRQNSYEVAVARREHSSRVGVPLLHGGSLTGLNFEQGQTEAAPRRKLGGGRRLARRTRNSRSIVGDSGLTTLVKWSISAETPGNSAILRAIVYSIKRCTGKSAALNRCTWLSIIPVRVPSGFGGKRGHEAQPADRSAHEANNPRRLVRNIGFACSPNNMSSPYGSISGPTVIDTAERSTPRLSTGLRNDVIRFIILLPSASRKRFRLRLASEGLPG
jgi:hypothetical protein